MDSVEERRRFQRLLVTLLVEYSAYHLETGELHQGEGLVKDFSLGGVYFHTLEPIPFQPGHVIHLTIITPLAPLSHLDSSHIQVQAEILRLDEPTEENGCHGVAASFLHYPSFLFAANSLNSAVN
ncbi:MAG: PilZ domain-containing protein [Desulfobaccales bacterium]